jgi:SAM-dependent methyltransferase
MSEVLKCRICGNEHQNQSIIATEKLMGFGDEFLYFECSRCRCLQIKDFPEDLAKYYPQEYYSYQEPSFERKLNPVLYFLKKSLASYYLGSFNPIGWLLSFFLEHPFPWLKSNIVDFNAKILDVGCGSGRKLLSMQRSGFKNLTGIDPYNSDDIVYKTGLKIWKKDIFSVTENYDFIMLHHSFEHMDSPKEVLNKLLELLNPGGHILIRIPVANSYLWRKYKTNWFALDAPRHLFLHTTESMRLLAEETGMKIDSIDYDSPASQILFCETYLRGLHPYKENRIFTEKEKRQFVHEINRLNQIHDGDCACFILSAKTKISN